MTREVFFETITRGHRPLVAWYLARGWRVRVFDFSCRLKSMAWMRPLLFEGRVERVYVHINSRADGLAIDAAELLFHRFAGHRLIRRMGAIFGREESEPVFKHALVESLSRYFFCRLYLEERLRSGGAAARVEFVPDSYRRWDRLLEEWCRTRGIGGIAAVRIPPLPALGSEWLGAWGRRAQQLPRYLSAGILALAAGVLRVLRRGWRSEPPVACTYLYAIDSKFQTKFEGGRRFDFLLDGERITRENTLFLVHPSVEGPWLEQTRREGCRVLLRSECQGLKGFLHHPPRGIPVGAALRAVGTGLARIGAPEWLHAAATTGLGILTRELNTLERVRFSHYIYSSQYRLTPRWRNILIRRAGGQSWWFAYSNGGGHLYRQHGPFGGDGDFGGRHRFWAHENADHFVSPSAALVEYHRSHHQRIRHYHDVGNIWSEQILAMGSSLNVEQVRAEWFGPRARGKKVIAWFDTTFVEAPNSPSTITEAIRSYRDLLRLVSEDERICAVIKPSKDEGYFVGEGPDRQWAIPRLGHGLMEVWREMRSQPGIRFLPDSADPTVVVAASDLTVTFHVSSVSAEALGARRRGIWYEPGERWRDTPMGREPLLAAHGYAELKALVEKLLFEMSDTAYEVFLEERVRGRVETWMDGKGLTRFRDLLAGGAAADRSVRETARWAISAAR